jgi:hypothetical protein
MRARQSVSDATPLFERKRLNQGVEAHVNNKEVNKRNKRYFKSKAIGNRWSYGYYGHQEVEFKVVRALMAWFLVRKSP